MTCVEPQHAMHVVDWYLWLAMHSSSIVSAWDYWCTCAERYADGEEEREGLYR